MFQEYASADDAAQYLRDIATAVRGSWDPNWETFCVRIGAAVRLLNRPPEPNILDLLSDSDDDDNAPPPSQTPGGDVEMSDSTRPPTPPVLPGPAVTSAFKGKARAIAPKVRPSTSSAPRPVLPMLPPPLPIARSTSGQSTGSKRSRESSEGVSVGSSMSSKRHQGGGGPPSLTVPLVSRKVWGAAYADAGAPDYARFAAMSFDDVIRYAAAHPSEAVGFFGDNMVRFDFDLPGVLC